MTETTQAENEVRGDADPARSRAHMHYAVLRLAGRVPDDVLVRSRDLLARRQVVEAASSLMFAVTQYRVPIDGRDAGLLVDLLTDRPGSVPSPAELDVVDGDVMTPYVFDHPEGGGNDPATGEHLAPPELDRELDGDPEVVRSAAVRWAEDRAQEVVGVWRAVRSPSVPASWPRPRLVWVVEVTDDADAVGVTASVTELLREHGVSLPLVECYHLGTRLPAYQDVARLTGELVWWSERLVGREDPTVARVFDVIDEAGRPGFHDDHARIQEEERPALADYLAAGEPLLMTTGLMVDVLDPERGEVVPLGFRTDGRWIWVDAVEYYLTEHGIAPEPGLLEHLRERAGTEPTPSGVQLCRALAVMRRGETDEDGENPTGAS